MLRNAVPTRDVVVSLRHLATRHVAAAMPQGEMYKIVAN